MLFKLVPTKGGHAGLDASCSQGDENQTRHGQCSGDTHTHWITHICAVRLSSSILSVFNSHVEGHVVGDAIPVVVRDVMNGAHRQDNLTHRVNDGQVNDSPALKGGRIRGEISLTGWFLTTKEYFFCR